MAKIFDNHLSKWLTLFLAILVLVVGWLIASAVGKATMAQDIITIKKVQAVDDKEDKVQEAKVSTIDKVQAVMQKDIEIIQGDVGDIKIDMKEVLRRLPK